MSFEIPALCRFNLMLRQLILRPITLVHSERPKLYAILAFLSAVGLKQNFSHNRTMIGGG